MKLSMDMGALSSIYGEKEGLRLIKEAGFDSVDYSFYEIKASGENAYTYSVFDVEKSHGREYVAYAKQMRAYLDEIGLSCNQAHAPFGMQADKNTFDLSDPIYANIVKAMEMAAILGAECIVVHALVPPKGESVIDFNYNLYKSLEPYCEKFQIKIAIENLFGREYDEAQGHYVNNRFGTPEEMKEMLEKLQSPWFVCCLDVGHAAISGIEPSEYARGLNSKVLKALHIQDNFYSSEDTHTLPYLGKIRWEELMKSLAEIGYEGELTFEIFKYLLGVPKELIPAALKFSVAVGRHLVDLKEKYEKANF